MKKLTQEEFVEKARIVHGDRYDYSKVEYVNALTKVCIICKEHGEFYQTPSAHLRGNGCIKCANAYKPTTEEFIAKAEHKFGNKFDYSKVIYKNSKTKVCIICPEHGEFWQTPYAHLNSKCGCNKCSAKCISNSLSHNTSIFVKKAIAIHGNKYDYSKVEYVSAHKPVTIICPVHGEFIQKPVDHLHSHGCPKCANNIKKTNDVFLQEAHEVHGFKYKYLSPYINSNSKLKIECPKHGLFTQTAEAHLLGQGCPKCAYEQRKQSLMYDTSIFIDKANKVHNNFYDYSLTLYVNHKTPVKIICPIHGEFSQLPVLHLLGCGCKKCHLKSQLKLYNILQETFPDLKLIFEATNKDIPWAKNYRFDIYNKEYNFIVEYDGELHFLAIKFFGGLEKLEKRQQLDKEKDELCKNNNCKLFRVKYNYTEDDLNRIKQEINLILNLY